MTTQYTTLLKLALPVQGELSGTWGTVVNENITEMIEEAVAGLSTINSWTTNSHVLTIADGTTAESRAAILELADDGLGNPTAAATVICPALSKIYIVKNGCGQTATIKTSAGTGVAIPDGDTALVYCDGTNVVTGSNFFGDIDVDGGTIDGVTLGTNSAITEAQIDNININGNAITSTDTNGNIALTPNGTGEVDISKVDIDSGAIDGTIIGANSAAAGTFTTLTTSSTISGTDMTITTIEATNYKANDGTDAMTIADTTGVVTISTELNVDNINISGNSIISTDTNGNIALTPNGTGEVDISKVDIDAGAIDGTTIGAASAAAGTFTNVTATGTLAVTSTTTATGGLSVDTISEITGDAGVTVDGVVLKDNGITATGGGSLTGTWTDLGSVTTVAINGGTIDDTTIGGTTPAAGSFTTGQFGTSLNVDGTITADGLTVDGTTNLQGTNPDLYFIESDTTDLNTYIANGSGNFTTYTANDAKDNFKQRINIEHSTGDISFYEDTGVTPKFFWDAANERLGIGTTGPATTLHVNSGSNGEILRIQGADAQLRIDNSTSNVMNINSSGSGDSLTLSTNDTERLRIDSSGTTHVKNSKAYGSETAALRVQTIPTGTNYSSGAFQNIVFGDESTANSYLGQLAVVQTDATVSTQSTMRFYTNGGGGNAATLERLRINSDGSVVFKPDGTNPDMTLNADGRLLVNITSEIAASTATVQSSGTGKPPLLLNRTNNGEIAQFYFNGATKTGAIETYGNVVTGFTLRPSHQANPSGLRGAANSIIPYYDGSDRNDEIDLGSSSVNWKDLYISSAIVQGGTLLTTTSTTADQVVDSFSASTYKGCKAVITVNDGTDTYVTELLIATDGSSATATEYGQVGTGSALATFDVDVSGGNVRILTTPAAATSTTFKVAKQLM